MLHTNCQLSKHRNAQRAKSEVTSVRKRVLTCLQAGRSSQLTILTSVRSHLWSNTHTHSSMATDLEKKIAQQIEYYFGDINLPRDKFMQEKMKEDDGWIPLDVLLTFNRLANLSKDPELIAGAVEKSETHLVIVSEDKKKLKRNPDIPLPEMNEERKKELAQRTGKRNIF